MATTYDEIQGFLDEKEIKHTRGPNFIRTGFATENYQDADGDKTLGVVIALDENGEYLKVLAPRAYEIKKGPNTLATMQTMMMIQWKTKLIQFEYDASDGEIRVIVEFPLEDAKLTARQFNRVLGGLVSLVDDMDPVIRKAIESGEIDFPDPETTALAAALEGASVEEVRQVLEELRRRRNQGGSPEEL